MSQWNEQAYWHYLVVLLASDFVSTMWQYNFQRGTKVPLSAPLEAVWQLFSYPFKRRTARTKPG